MVGGLIVSQALTLFTTPVIYLYLDRLSNWLSKSGRRRPGATGGDLGEEGWVEERREAAE